MRQISALAGASWLALASVGLAETPPDPRDAKILELEAKLEAIQDQIADLKASNAAETADLRRVADELPKVTISKGRPTIASADGAFKFAVRGMAQFDTAIYDQDDGAAVDNRRSGNGTEQNARDLNSGTNFRRARIGLEGTVFKDWNYAITGEFGGSGSESAQLQQAWVEYAGWKPFGIATRLRAGAFAPPTGLEDATSNTDSLFLERAAGVELIRGLAGGDGRSGFGILANGERWNASAVLTGALVGTGSGANYDEQTGVVARADYLLFRTANSGVHIGANYNAIITPGDIVAPGGGPNLNAITLQERPELRVDGTRLVSTGGITSDGVNAYGFEAGAQWKNFYIAGEYNTISVERSGLPDAEFDTWYVQGSWILTGEKRGWSAATGGFGGVRPDKPFNPKKNQWGAWELAARYSTLNLNDNEGAAGAATPAGGIRGGEQEITSLGLNWTPNNVVRFLLQFQDVSVDRLYPGTTGAGNPPVGAQIGQHYQTYALRTQFAF
jgi:phosphate-selective porin OprO/OprP